MSGYSTGLRRAEAHGYSRGLEGLPIEPSGYVRNDYIARYETGWRRGATKREQEKPPMTDAASHGSGKL